MALLSLQSYSQTKYSISGNVKGVKEGIDKVYLSYRMGDEGFEDSAIVKNGSYRFSGTRQEPGLVTLIAGKADGRDPEQRDVARIFILGGQISIIHSDAFSNAKVTGSREHASYLVMDQKLRATDEEMDKKNEEYMTLREKGDKAGMERLAKEMDGVYQKQRQVYKDMFISDPSSPLAMYQLQRFAGWDINADEVDPLYNMLPGSWKNSSSGKQMAEKIDLSKRLGIGRVAPDFTQNDTSGTPVSLSSFRGKYLLLDFWASWCSPCRQENPNLVKAFRKYSARGFHVLGVSLDQPNGKEKWLKAIHDDGLTWTHVSDLQFWRNAVALQYGIQAVPQNYLLDPEGKILAKNLSGDELEKKLAEIFK